VFPRALGRSCSGRPRLLHEQPSARRLGLTHSTSNANRKCQEWRKCQECQERIDWLTRAFVYWNSGHLVSS
jgi:hypothetical protein